MPATAKHKASLLIRVEVHEQAENGECITPVTPSELAQFDIKTKAVYTIEGFDKFECLKKLKGVLDGLTRKN
jgi:hypothetical protein